MKSTTTTYHSDPHDDILHISDELLEKLGDYYISEYVTLNRSYIRQLPFEEWVTKEVGKKLQDAVSF